MLHIDIESIKSTYSGSLLEKSVNSRSRRPLEEMIPNAPPDGLDLLKLLLQFNPEKRLTAEEALLHPFVSKFHKSADEVSLTYDVVPPVDDDVQLTVNEYRDKLYEVNMDYLHFLFILRLRFCSHKYKNLLFLIYMQPYYVCFSVLVSLYVCTYICPYSPVPNRREGVLANRASEKPLTFDKRWVGSKLTGGSCNLRKALKLL